MQRVFTFLVPALFLCLSASAQSPNWSTIRESDTVYFEGGHFYAVDNTLGISQNDSFRLLRMIRVDSSYQTSSGKMLFFPTTIRQQNNSNMPCLLPRAGWQGSYCLRKPNGEELFFNRRGDTVHISTLASPGATWLVLRDSSGIEIRATALGVGTTLVDGVVDSFRETSLQAYSNNAPVAHRYNGLKLRWSKMHGWLQTLDFYTFPYLPMSGIRSGALEDSAQYMRKPQNLPFYKGLSDSDVYRKYTPGNEWIFYFNSGVAGLPMYDFYGYDADSVISRQQAGNQLLATIRYHHVENQYTPNGYVIRLNSGTRTDTISLGQTLVPFPEILQPDVPDTTSLRGGNPAYQPLYAADTLCEGHIQVRTRPFSNTDILYKDSVCIHLAGNLSGTTFTGEDYLVKFGSTLRFSYDVPYGMKSIRHLVYLRLGTCTWGRYINIPTLSVENKLPDAHVWLLAPNPAVTDVMLQGPTLPENTTVRITDYQGRMLLEKQAVTGKAQWSVAGWPAGLYLVRISGPSGNQVLKLQVLP